MIRLLLATLFLEVGFVLAVVPWSAYWDRNYFAEAVPQLHAIITNNFLRGAVSGLGLINLAAGIVDLVTVIRSRKPRDSTLHIIPRQSVAVDRLPGDEYNVETAK